MGKIAIVLVLLLLNVESVQKLGWARDKKESAPPKERAVRIPVWVRNGANSFKAGVGCSIFESPAAEIACR